MAYLAAKFDAIQTIQFYATANPLLFLFISEQHVQRVLEPKLEHIRFSVYTRIHTTPKLLLFGS